MLQPVNYDLQQYTQKINSIAETVNTLIILETNIPSIEPLAALLMIADVKYPTTLLIGQVTEVGGLRANQKPALT